MIWSKISNVERIQGQVARKYSHGNHGNFSAGFLQQTRENTFITMLVSLCFIFYNANYLWHHLAWWLNTSINQQDYPWTAISSSAAAWSGVGLNILPLQRDSLVMDRTVWFQPYCHQRCEKNCEFWTCKLKPVEQCTSVISLSFPNVWVVVSVTNQPDWCKVSSLKTLSLLIMSQH